MVGTDALRELHGPAVQKRLSRIGIPGQGSGMPEVTNGVVAAENPR